MACLQVDPSGNFHLSFRLGNRKYKRSLRTKSEREAFARQACVEENIRPLTSGRLALPSNADVATFLLSDGRQLHPLVAPSDIRLRSLCDDFLRLFRVGIWKTTPSN